MAPLRMSLEQYRAAITACPAPPDVEHVRCLVDIRCLENRAWLRASFNIPISYRDYEAVYMRRETFAQDPELTAMLGLPDSILVVEAGGQLLVARIPMD